MEQRYYVTKDEADVIQQAADATDQSKSDYARQATMEAAIGTLSKLGRKVEPELVRRYGRGPKPDPGSSRNPDADIIEAFDALRSVLLAKYRKES